MKKIYEQLKDLHVRNIIFYGKSGDDKLYVDEAFEKQVTKAQAEDAFLKGQLLIKVDNAYAVPSVYSDGTVNVCIGGESQEFSVAVPEAE